jgi:hypothetical protein
MLPTHSYNKILIKYNPQNKWYRNHTKTFDYWNKKTQALVIIEAIRSFKWKEICTRTIMSQNDEGDTLQQGGYQSFLQLDPKPITIHLYAFPGLKFLAFHYLIAEDQIIFCAQSSHPLA